MSIIVTPGGGGGGGGIIRQIVSVQDSTFIDTATNTPIDDTVPTSTEGAEVLTLAITPINAVSILLIEWSLYINGAAVRNSVITLLKDSDVAAIAASPSVVSGANQSDMVPGFHSIAAGTTDLQTFKLRLGSNAGNVIYNGITTGRVYGAIPKSWMKITEIDP